MADYFLSLYKVWGISYINYDLIIFSRRHAFSIVSPHETASCWSYFTVKDKLFLDFLFFQLHFLEMKFDFVYCAPLHRYWRFTLCQVQWINLAHGYVQSTAFMNAWPSAEFDELIQPTVSVPVATVISCVIFNVRLSVKYLLTTLPSSGSPTSTSMTIRFGSCKKLFSSVAWIEFLAQ